MTINIPVSPGELLDKITILQIKEIAIKDETKLANVRAELAMLLKAAEQIEMTKALQNIIGALRTANWRVWEAVEESYSSASQKDYGKNFIKWSLHVLTFNDERAKLKRQINDLLNSEIKEEKHYAAP